MRVNLGEVRLSELDAVAGRLGRWCGDGSVVCEQGRVELLAGREARDPRPPRGHYDLFSGIAVLA